MPLTQRVDLKTVLQHGNRVQIPKFVRLQFKIGENEVLQVRIACMTGGLGWQSFYAKIGKDGRISIPKLTLSLMHGESHDLVGSIFEIMLDPP